MIGGQIIVPIRGVNNEKISLTTTYQDVKKGTYAKIERALNMQKELVLEDLIVGTNIITSASVFVLSRYISAGQPLVGISIFYVASDGTSKSVLVYVRGDDAISINNNLV